ncbi:gp16 family protein [Chitiniphilus shinanonensis]|uniref:gp16 family protein n=1 Tax=Chitiniphilus shinanonensis TaxID=553088 RepID=UPI0030385DA2
MDNRKRLIRLIHVAKRELAPLGLDDDTYRQMLENLTGKRSAAELTEAQLERVVAALKKRGFIVRPKVGKQVPLADDDMSRMIRGLWLELHELGFVANAAETALLRYCQRQTGVSALQWLNGKQAETMIESLKKWRDREALALARRLGLSSTAQSYQLEQVTKLCWQVAGSGLLSKANLAAVAHWIDERSAK